MPDDFEDIVYSIEGGVATITIDRSKKMNFLTPQPLQNFEDLLCQTDFLRR